MPMIACTGHCSLSDYHANKISLVTCNEKEPAFPFFGKNPEQPKTTALAVFSYLSNDDLFNSGLVCKQWSQLATDEELWQF